MGDKNDREDMPLLMSRSLMFKAIMEYSLDSIFFKDKDLRFIYANKSMATRNGFKDPVEMYGKNDFDFISESTAKGLFEIEKSILETGHPVIGKIEKLTRLNGSEAWAKPLECLNK